MVRETSPCYLHHDSSPRTQGAAAKGAMQQPDAGRKGDGGHEPAFVDRSGVDGNIHRRIRTSMIP
jgi:hypothetical protein